MGKKKVLLIVLAAVIVLIAAVAVYVVVDCNTVKPFSLQDYAEYTHNFAQNEYFEPYIDVYQARPVETADKARKVAEEVWSTIYPDRVQSEKPYLVFYDEAENVWMVQGTPDYIGFGGTAGILVKTDGEILAIWHGK